MEEVQLATFVTIFLVVVVALFAWFIGVRGFRQESEATPQAETYAPDAKVEQYERPSSIAAEQIEALVRQKLDAYPDLADTVLDFATADDGTVDVWVNRRQYDNIEDIPDERVRTAIREAVKSFNA